MVFLPRPIILPGSMLNCPILSKQKGKTRQSMEHKAELKCHHSPPWCWDSSGRGYVINGSRRVRWTSSGRGLVAKAIKKFQRLPSPLVLKAREVAHCLICWIPYGLVHSCLLVQYFLVLIWTPQSQIPLKMTPLMHQWNWINGFVEPTLSVTNHKW